MSRLEARPDDAADAPAPPHPRVDAILSGAAQAFSANGFAATSMREIAQRADASLGTIYYHFESKDEILRALICGNFQRVHTALDAALEQVDDPREALRVFIDNHIRFFASRLAEMRVMSHELDTLAGEAGADVSAQRDAYSAKATVILGRLRPDLEEGELRVHALCLFGMLNWTYRWFHTVDRKMGASGIAERMTSLFVDGFAPAGGR